MRDFTIRFLFELITKKKKNGIFFMVLYFFLKVKGLIFQFKTIYFQFEDIYNFVLYINQVWKKTWSLIMIFYESILELNASIQLIKI